jgi:superfamily I DNA/RNA helicase
MTKLIGRVSENSTAGERKIAQYLDSLFENDPDTIVRYEPWVGEQRPDFLILSRRWGVIILEIKDYRSENLQKISKTGQWELLIADKINSVHNPFDQLYEYFKAISNRIQQCQFPAIVQVPITQIVIFPNIEFSTPTASLIYQEKPAKIKCGFSNALHSIHAFQEFLDDHGSTAIGLDGKNFDVLQFAIIPLARIPSPTQYDLTTYLSLKEKIKLLDVEQEKIARELGEGHRLFFGVAGSGKTILLIARARYLARKYPTWRILVLTYNKLLSRYIYHLLVPQDSPGDITVSSFHKWAKDTIDLAGGELRGIYYQAFENAEKQKKLDEFFNAVVPQILHKVIDSMPTLQYNAILIDEAQDFAEEWFRVLIRTLNPDTNSLFITCDGLQGIYARHQFHWVDVGIKAKGRVRKFTKSYRNPKEIGLCAKEVLPENLAKKLNLFDEFLKTEEYGKVKGKIEFIQSTSRKDEYIQIIDKLEANLSANRQILILFRMNLTKSHLNHPFLHMLIERNIQWKEFEDWARMDGGLFIGTPQATKGLEAEMVVIPELDMYETEEDQQLLYVAMTRSMERLILSFSNMTNLINRLKNIKL